MNTVAYSMNALEIGKFLTDLVGVEIKCATAPNPDSGAMQVCAEYVNDDGEVGGGIFMDVAAAARLGAAFTRIPMGGADDAIKAGELPANLAENLYEVLNIAVNLLPESRNQRLVLSRVVYKSDALEAFAAQSGDVCGTFQLDVLRYGKGALVVASK